MINKSLQIAKYIYYRGYTDNIKLNKLLYISFGFYGARYEKYLFQDIIQAWKYGPVIPTVYSAYKDGSLNYINFTTIDYQEREVIDEVLAFYGEKAPFLLVELTHQKDTPWSNVCVEGQKNIEINKDDIIKYYTSFLNRTDS